MELSFSCAAWKVIIEFLLVEEGEEPFMDLTCADPLHAAEVGWALAKIAGGAGDLLLEDA